MSDIAEDELYEMVNLPPRLTGLPMTVWARSHGNAQHDISIARAHYGPDQPRLQRPQHCDRDEVGSTRNDSH